MPPPPPGPEDQSYDSLRRRLDDFEALDAYGFNNEEGDLDPGLAAEPIEGLETVVARCDNLPALTRAAILAMVQEPDP